MSDRRPLIEQWLDLTLYAPIGILVAAREDLPELVQRGRERAEQRVQVARFFGQMAVAYAKVEAQKRREAAARPPQQPVPATAVDITPDLAEAVPPPDHVDVDVVVPFEGYDTMAAVHIVERLRRMPPGELRAVRDYEAATRGRRTILGKIDQLLR